LHRAAERPFEANVPHHFAFRGCDDAGCVAAGFLAARAAKESGVRTFILQIMLNTPRRTWGVQDLAKARALLGMVRGLEEAGRFRVVLQSRPGLDYISARGNGRGPLAATPPWPTTTSRGRVQSADHFPWCRTPRPGLADPRIMLRQLQIVLASLARIRLRRAGNAPTRRKTNRLSAQDGFEGRGGSPGPAIDEAIPGPSSPGNSTGH
jgi:hypothetical protein